MANYLTSSFKRLFLLLLIFVFVLTACFCGQNFSAVAIEIEEYGFEDKTVGQGLSYPWVTKNSVLVAKDPLNNNNKSIHISDNSVKASSEAVLYFNRTYAETTVSFDLLIPSKCEWSAGLFADDLLNSLQISLVGDTDGTLKVFDYSTEISVGEYAINKWFNVEIVANPISKLYSIYIDDAAIIKDAQFKRSGLDFNFISGLVIKSSFITTADFYFDNIVSPSLNRTVVERYVPLNETVQVVSTTASTDEMLYHNLPSIEWLNDTQVLTVYRRSTKEASAYSVIEAAVFDTVEEKTVNTAVLYQLSSRNATNPEIIKMPNGELFVFVGIQVVVSSAINDASVVLRSTDNGKNWTTDSNGLVDGSGLKYSAVYDSVVVDNDIYILANATDDVNTTAATSTLGVHILKSIDNGQNWTSVKNLNYETGAKLSEGSIESTKDGFIIVSGTESNHTIALKVDKDFNVINERNLSLDFSCIGLIKRPRLFVENGKYFLLGCNILPDSNRELTLTLHEISPETLSILTNVRLQPANTGNEVGGFYAEYFMSEKDGEEIFNVITHSSAYSDNKMPQIIRLEYLAEEVLYAGKDETAPKISGIENGNTYYVTQNLSISDLFLDNVTLSGEDITQGTTIPGSTSTVTLTLDKDSYNYQTLVPGTGRNVSGVVSASSAEYRIFSRPEGINGSGAIKWSNSAGSTAIMFGRENVGASGTSAAYVLEPNTNYTVSFYFKNSTANIKIGLAGTANYEDVLGYELFSQTLTSTSSNFVQYSASFKTPAEEVLGNNKYLSFVITKPDTVASYTALLDDVTINKIIPDEIIVNNKQSITLEGNKMATYNIVATDTSNHSTSVTVYMNPIATIDQATKELTVSNVTEDDREVILEAKAKAEAIDLTYATESEKAEVAALIDKYTKLIKKLDGTLCEEHIYDNVLDTECNVCGFVREKHVGKTLVKLDGIWYYVVDGELSTDTTLVKYNGVYYYVKNGVKNDTENTLCLYNGVYYHVKGGKYIKDTTLVKYNSKWYYVENGVYVKKTALVKYGNTYYYVKNGVKTNTANTLVKIDGKWYHVKDGKWAKDTTLVKYTDGNYYYVKDGVKNTTANTLCKYGSAYYHVKGGKWVKDTTLVKYNSKWYYVKNGKFDKTFNGKVLYGGKYYTVKNGVKV